MKQTLLALITFFCTTHFVNAQAGMSPTARLLQHDIQKFLAPDGKSLLEINNNFLTFYDVYAKRGHYYVGAVVLTEAVFDEKLLENEGLIISSRIGNIRCVRVPLEKFSTLVNIPGIVYIEAGSQVEPFLDRSRFSTRADSVHQGLGGLATSYTGKGVIVAVIDWGFDYTHPVFYDTTMQHYRVSRAWDQNKTSGPAPAGYDFGTEYVGMQELLAAKEDTLYVFGPGSHGTHTSGIAGGSGAKTKYTGIAPECELVFISLRRDDPSFLDAISYVAGYADAVNKPFVVNMSFGGHSGPHDGSSLRSQGLDLLSGKGKVFVASAGNNGGENFHLLHDAAADGDTLRTVLDFPTGYADYWGQNITAWGQKDQRFSIILEAFNGSNQSAYTSPVYSSSFTGVIEDTLYINGGDTLIIRLTSEAKNSLNGCPNIVFDVRKSGSLKVKMISVAETGKIHYWQVIRLNNRVSNWGSPFLNTLPGTKTGNDQYGVGGEPGVTKEVITVAAHRGEVVLPNGQLALGQLSTFSSRGPTVDERVKPDISGPGQDVASSVNSYDPNRGTPELTITYNGRDYDFVKYSGTSMSGPAVAGVVALMLEANPNLTSREVKEIIKTTARLDANTGVIPPGGSLSWGWGKVNALAAVRLAEIKLNVPGELLQDMVSVYPNPAIFQLNFTWGNEDFQTLKIIDLNGKEVSVTNLEKGSSSCSLNVSTFPAGIYLVELSGTCGTVFKKVVVGR